MAAEKKSSNTCLFLGLGCGCGLMLVAALIGGAIFWAGHSLEQFAEGFEDPAVREAKTLEILKTESLPAGYSPVIGLELPMILRFAIISDAPPEAPLPESPETPEAGAGLEVPRGAEHAFYFFEFLRLASLGLGEEQKQGLEDFFGGVTDDPAALDGIDIDVDLREVLRRGELESDEMDLLYVVGRGEQPEMQDGPVLMTLMWVRCPRDSRLRLANWIGPNVETASPGDELDLTGTVGDEALLAPFLAHFSLCG